MDVHHRRRTGVAGQVLQGAVAGAIATVPMTAVMLLAERLGLMDRQPPKQITEVGLEAADAPVEDEETRTLLASIAHVGFGAGGGALFTVLHRRLRPPVPDVVHGLGFGLLVWAGSYKGWIPALGILPPPERDRPGRARTMVLAHLVYGAALGAIEGRRR